MRRLFVSLSLLALVAASATPALAYGTRLQFDLAQGFHFNPASHANVGYLITLGLPGDIPVKTPDGTTKKVAMVLKGLTYTHNDIGLEGRVSAATKERFKNANRPEAITHISFSLECWAYDSFSKRYYKTVSTLGKEVDGFMPGDKRPGYIPRSHQVSNYTKIDLSPSVEVASPVNYLFSFHTKASSSHTWEVATSATHKEIFSWGGH